MSVRSPKKLPEFITPSDYKIAIVDIENAPNLGYVWDKYEQNVLAYEEEWYMLSFAWKWYGSKSKAQCLALPDFSLYKKDPHDDSALVSELWGVFDEADLIVWHNGDRFDRRKSNTRFLWNRLGVPRPYKTFDTLLEMREQFKFNSNKLGDAAEFLGYPGKVKHHGFGTWLGCIKEDPVQWAIMKKYNAHDVVINEWVYDEIKPWSTRHPNITLATGISGACPVCGETEYMERRGFRRLKSYVAQSWHCNPDRGGCGKWSQGTRVKDPNVILSS